MKRLAPFLGYLLCAIFLAAWIGAERSASSQNAESARLRAALDSLATVQPRIDSVHTVRVDTVVRRIARVDTLTATVEVWKRDTLEVVRYVVATDSALRACSAVIVSCDDKVRVRDQRIALLDSLNANTESRLRAETARGRRDRIVFGALGALAGWALKP